jgi:Flp pilus assembly pilin Flp
MLEVVMWARLGSRLAALKVASGSRRAAERLRREQTGQDLIEYGGILILVAAIIAALLATGIVSDVGTFVKSAVNNIIGSSAAQNATATKGG